MPFSSFRPDGPSRGGPDRAFPPSSSFSYSTYPSQNHRPSKPSNLPRPRPQTTFPFPVHDPAKLLHLPPPAVNLRVAATPPLLSLPTPPSSDFSPPSKNAKGSKTTTDLDENSSFDIPAEAKTPTSVLLHALTPDALQAIRESRESRFIFRNITPSDFAAWLDLYPELDECDTARYDYDGFSERMIIKCMAGSVHDSLPIFFIRVVTDGLQQVGPGSRRMLQVCTNTDFANFMGEYEDTNSRKAPDAYIKVAGIPGFPCVVAEVGWCESMEDLMADARLWLLGTGGQTKVVIIVKFTEDKRGPRSASPASSSSSNATDADADDAGPNDQDAPPEPTEESLLLSTVTASTRLRALANTLLDLHHRGALAKPLIGPFTATFHVFRRTPEDTIYEDFTATVLPAPAPADDNTQQDPQTYALTLGDMFGDNPLPAGVDPRLAIVFDMDVFREDIALQVPDMEVKRSFDRAKAILQRRGFWERPKTFAGAKRAKRKRGEGGEEDEEYKKKVR